MCSSNISQQYFHVKHWYLLHIIICNATILNLEYWKSTEGKLLLLIKLATWAVHGAELSKFELHRPHIWVVCESSLIWSTPLRQVHPLFLCSPTTTAAPPLQRPEQSNCPRMPRYLSWSGVIDYFCWLNYMLQDLSFEENYEKYHDEKLIKSMNTTVRIYSMLFHVPFIWCLFSCCLHVQWSSHIACAPN